MSCVYAQGAVAAPPQEAEEAYDLIQEVEWNRELSNTITLIGHLGCVSLGPLTSLQCRIRAFIELCAA